MPTPPPSIPPFFASERLADLLAWLSEQGETGLGAREVAEVLWLARLLPTDATEEHHGAPLDQGWDDDSRALPSPRVKPSADPRNGGEETRGEESAAEDSMGTIPLMPWAARPTMEDLPQAMPVWLEDPPLLGNSLHYLRAISPLLAQRAESGRMRVDEEETVNRFAHDLADHVGGRCPPITPVWRPVPEPRFDLLLAVDGGLSMRLWDRMLPELRHLFGSGGAFRDLRILPLCDPQGQLRPLAQLTPMRREGCQLLLLLSDCTGDHWWTGAILPILERWGNRLPFAVLQVLPRRMWERTAIGPGEALTLANRMPAAPVARYRSQALRRHSRRRRLGAAGPPPEEVGVLVPVLSCDPDSLGSWSAVVMGDPRQRIAGCRLFPPPRPSLEADPSLASAPEPPPSPPPTDPMRQWRRFQELASPHGQELARLLAAAPVLTLPVMRLVKQALMAGDQTPLAMAEVLLGGLLRVIPGQGGQGEDDPHLGLQFDFRPGLRDHLLAQSNHADTLAVMNAVSLLVEQRWNRFAPDQSFRAFLQDPRLHAPTELEGLQSFGRVMADIVERLGGPYQAFAQRLRLGAEKISEEDPSLQGADPPPDGHPRPSSVPGLVLLSFDTRELGPFSARDAEHVEEAMDKGMGFSPLVEQLCQALQHQGIQVLRSDEVEDQTFGAPAASAVERAALLLAVITPAALHSHRRMVEEWMPAFLRWGPNREDLEHRLLAVWVDGARTRLAGDGLHSLVKFWRKELARTPPRGARRGEQSGPNLKDETFLAHLPDLLSVLQSQTTTISRGRDTALACAAISKRVRERLETLENFPPAVEPEHPMTTWIDCCDPPRPRPEGKDWDVFLSYRSLDRLWTIALHDALRQCGYRVFLDQFVLVAGQGLNSQLGKNLERSASGVLIWSTRTSDSAWVEAEIDAMNAMQKNSKGTEFPFFYVVASLDGQKPPGLLGGQLYLDFSAYPDGPTGVELVKLISGLQGKPPGEEAVRLATAYDTALKQEPADLRAVAQAELYDDIVAKVKGDDPAFTTTAQLSALAVELLIRGRQYAAGDLGKAGDALATALERFPGSVRLRQLRGLLLRRTGQPQRAQVELTRLLEESQRDTETLGMLAAVWADLWAKRLADGDPDGARDALEQSQSLYAEGFSKVPTDTYTGINAASKAALLGDLLQAKGLASRVLERLKEQEAARGGGPSPDYWERVTEPEALLLTGEVKQALKLYHEARVAHQNERGSIESTALQVKRLLEVLPLEADDQAALAKEFRLDKPPG